MSTSGSRMIIMTGSGARVVPPCCSLSLSCFEQKTRMQDLVGARLNLDGTLSGVRFRDDQFHTPEHVRTVTVPATLLGADNL